MTIGKKSYIVQLCSIFLIFSLMLTVIANTGNITVVYYKAGNHSLFAPIKFSSLHHVEDSDYIAIGNIRFDYGIDDSPYDSTYNGIYDLFIMRTNSIGVPQWMTYLGGSASEFLGGSTIYEDKIIIAGNTRSDDFPGQNDYTENSSDWGDFFLSVFGTDGRLTWAKVIGGEKDDRATDVATDSIGNIYVVGNTRSRDFPVGSANSTPSTNYRGFVTKFTPDGMLLWSRYIPYYNETGISNILTEVNTIEIDRNDELIISGVTAEGELSQQEKINQDMEFNGNEDVFVMKLDADGEDKWLSYFGGTGYDRIDSMQIDSQDQIVIAGTTSSPDLPLLNPYDSQFSYNSTEQPFYYDGYLAILSTSGQLSWSTYIGEDDPEIYNVEISIDDNDRLYFGFQTTTHTLETTENQSPSGSSIYYGIFEKDKLVHSSYLSGSSDDYFVGLLASHDDVIISGYTVSEDFMRGNDDICNNGGCYNTPFLLIIQDDFSWSERVQYQYLESPFVLFMYALIPISIIMIIVTYKYRKYRNKKPRVDDENSIFREYTK